DKCVTYYRCQGGLLLGRFYCPASLGFNEDLQICDYTRNLRHPCGPLPSLKTTTVATTTTTAATKQTATTKVTVTMTPPVTATTSGVPTTSGLPTTPPVGGGPIVG
ncbi:hypothetical protein EGW08_001565, partial [Elysia chlorotica]